MTHDSTDWTALRRRFPGAEQMTYLDGNSLGLCSTQAQAALEQRLAEWQTLGIGGWTDPRASWLHLSREIAAAMAPLVGAAPERLWVHGTTTLMLHQLLSTLWQPADGRDTILLEAGPFPTDAYAAQSHQRLRGLDDLRHIRYVEPDGDLLDEDAIIDAMQPPVGCVLLPAVIYTTGQWLDLKKITAAARERDILVLWDCSHAAGSVPLDLDELDADGAFWCGYKYLNGGPGAVAGGYLAPRHSEKLPGLAGWFGSSDDALFRMEATMTPAPSAKRMELGTPHVLSLAPMLPAVNMLAGVGIDALRERSLHLTSRLIKQIDDRLAPLGFSVATPRDPARRGGHIALRHPDAQTLVDHLTEHHVVTDFRYPDLCRVAPVAAYNNDDDIERFIETVEAWTRHGAA